MSHFSHIPVLLNESIESLNLSQGSTIVDCTLGLGGHSRVILEKIGPKGKLIAFDQDEANLKQAQENLKEYENQVVYVHDNFGNLAENFKRLGIDKVDGFLFDLGIASVHLDIAEKGFSIKKEGPLDMRMDQRTKLTAKEIVNNYLEEDLCKIFWKYGEEKSARKIAQAILSQRKEKLFQTTKELADLIEKLKPRGRWGGGHPAAQVFQALRIEVNQELVVLEKGLEDSISFLKEGGRLVVIAYHSLEDRIVKDLFKKYAKDCICSPDLPVCRCDWQAKLKVIHKLILPKAAEVSLNPRSRSAKMRVVEKII